MGEERENDAAPGDPLWRVVCAGCGYSLVGLPAGAGVCPECGGAYDPGNEVVLFGWACGELAQGHNRRPFSRWNWVMAGVALLFYGWLMAESAMSGKGLGGVQWFVLAVGVAWGVAWYRRRRLVGEGMAGAVVLRMSARGFVQRDGVGEAKWVAWSEGDRVEVWGEGKGKWRVRVRRRVWWVPGLVREKVNFSFDGGEGAGEALRGRVEGMRGRMKAEG